VLAPFQHQFSPQSAAVPLARHLLSDWLVAVPVEADAVDSLLLAVSELCSNAVRHASGAPGSIHLRAWAEVGDVHIEVSDDGGSLEWSEQRPEELPDPEAEQGRGLFLVRELVDDVSTSIVDGRSVVRVVRRAVVGGVPARVPG
jgi:serine/threonine-protein kinase RsbW